MYLDENIKILQSGDSAVVKKSWHYDPESTAEKGRVEGTDVTFLEYRYYDDKKSIGRVTIKSGATHGVVTTKADTYYVVLKGAVNFSFKKKVDDHLEDCRVTLREDDSLKIPAGTTCDYTACDSLGRDTELILFRDMVD